MAHLKTKETQKDPRSRKQWKFQLTRKLYEQGLERQDIMELFLFLDWLMELPDGLKQEFKTELEQYEQEKQMRYVSSIEEITIEETKREIVLVMLTKGLSIEEISSLTDIPIEKVAKIQSQQK
jgi:predicted transposase YdaD